MLLFFLRVILCTLVFFGGTALFIVLLLFGWGQDDRPYHYARTLMPVLLKIMGVKIELRNEAFGLQTQPHVYLGNHQSFIDAFVVGALFPKNTLCIGKSSIRFLPFFGWIFVLCRCILVNREKHESAMESMNRAAKEVITRKVSILMFPEGTRSRSVGMLPFKKGAFYLAKAVKCPLLPFVVSSYERSLNLKKWNAGTVIVEYLPPVPTDLEVEELIPLVRNQMLETLERLNKAYD